MSHTSDRGGQYLAVYLPSVLLGKKLVITPCSARQDDMDCGKVTAAGPACGWGFPGLRTHELVNQATHFVNY